MKASEIYSRKISYGDKVRVSATGEIGEIEYCQTTTIDREGTGMLVVFTNGEIHDISELEAI